MPAIWKGSYQGVTVYERSEQKCRRRLCEKTKVEKLPRGIDLIRTNVDFNLDSVLNYLNKQLGDSHG